ncbi:MAG: hypothetical protein ACTSRC_20120 [Candidatus Helarchaeota archaeon]
MENFEGALNRIIKIMNVTEKEKVKCVEILAALEKKIARRLRNGQMEEVINELEDIIDDYKILGLFNKAKILELTLNELLDEINSNSSTQADVLITSELETTQILQVLEARSKKAIRRFLQGKLDEAIETLLEIIEEFRHYKMMERAEALEDWMFRFLDKKLDEEDELEPLTERLKSDPILEEELLSFRVQKILKRFIKGAHRRAVEEFTALVNEYKSKGQLEIVETLELWFNLFITRTYLIPARRYKAKAADQKRVTEHYAGTHPETRNPPSLNLSTPPPIAIKKPKIHQNAQNPSNLPPPISDPQLDTSVKMEKPLPSVEDKFREKITKIKGLLKQFEESN